MSQATSLSDIYGVTDSYANPREEFIGFVLTKLNDIADLDMEVMKRNIAMLENTPDYPRRIYVKRLSFLVTYMAPFMRELVYNRKFRTLFCLQVIKEADLSRASNDQIRSVRESMMIPGAREGDSYIIYKKETFADEFYKSLLDIAKTSYNLLVKDQMIFLNDCKKIPPIQRKILGMCFSNFAFCFMGLAVNDKYVAYLAAVAKSIDKTYANSRKNS